MILLLTWHQLDCLCAVHGLTQFIIIIFRVHDATQLWSLRSDQMRRLFYFSGKDFWRPIFEDFIIMVSGNMISIMYTTLVFKYSIVTNTGNQLSEPLARIIIDQLLLLSCISPFKVELILKDWLFMIYFHLFIYQLLLLRRLEILKFFAFNLFFLRLGLILVLSLMNYCRWLNTCHVVVRIVKRLILLQLSH